MVEILTSACNRSRKRVYNRIGYIYWQSLLSVNASVRYTLSKKSDYNKFFEYTGYCLLIKRKTDFRRPRVQQRVLHLDNKRSQQIYVFIIYLKKYESIVFAGCTGTLRVLALARVCVRARWGVIARVSAERVCVSLRFIFI